MARYKIWDKQSDIYTLGKDEKGRNHFTAQEYLEENAPWAMNPNVDIIVGGGAINGTMFLDYATMVEQWKRMGCPITDEMTKDEVLATVETWENRPRTVEPDSQERIAAALEYQNAMM